MKRFITLLCTTLVLAAIAACGDDEAPKSGNGVNDVHQACEIRAKWNRTGNDCSLCESAAINAHCDCDSLRDFSGACLDQANTRKSACPADNTLDDCVFGCNAAVPPDCACIDKCYEAVPTACKTASNARDGCVAETCADRCK